MKKMIIILFAALSISSYAQNSFPTSNAIWNEESRILPRGFYQYGIKGETVINDTLYQNLYILSDTTLDCINEQSLPFGFIRQEGQKVYFRPCFWDYSDILLYDFGASVSDTVWHDAESGFYSIIYTIGIYNGRKAYYIQKSDRLPDIWYEGIGSYRGLFGPITAIPLYENFPNKLVCFKHNNIVEFLDNPQCNKCFCTNNSIDEKKIETIKIFPNPTTDMLFIECENHSTIKLYDMLGKEVVTKDANGKTEINISHLSKGVYTVSIISDGVVIGNRKIVKYY